METLFRKFWRLGTAGMVVVMGTGCLPPIQPETAPTAKPTATAEAGWPPKPPEGIFSEEFFRQALAASLQLSVLTKNGFEPLFSGD